jgi:hypothetical protein
MEGSGRCRLLALLLAAHIASPIASPAQVNLGFSVGINSSGLSGDAPSGVSYTGSTNFLAGVVADFGVADDVWISVQPGYVGRGTGIAFKIDGQEEPQDSLTLSLDYLALPVLLKVVTGNGKVYVTSGLDLSYLLSANLTPVSGGDGADVKDAFKTVSAGVIFGVGAMFPIGRPRITVEGRYTQSLTNDAEPARDENGSEIPLRFRSTGLQLLVGLLIPLGGR